MLTYRLLDNKLWPHVFTRSFSDTELGSRLGRQGLPPLGNSHDTGPWVAGGAVRREVMGEPLGKDIDFFFDSPSTFELYLDKLMTMPDKPTVLFETKRCIKLQIKPSFAKVFIVDLVCGSYFDSVDALFEDFDFTCCQFAVDRNSLYVGDLAMLHAAQRQLRANNWGRLKISYAHMVRYMHDGWHPGRPELDALLNDVGENKDVLIDDS